MRARSTHSERRWTVCVLLVEIAAIHICLVPQHLREAPYAGVLFIALSVTALTIAGAFVYGDQRRTWLSALLLVGSAIVAYVLSRSIGLPSLKDDIGDWTNPLGVGALTAEAITVAISLAVLCRSRSGRPQATSRTPPVTPLATGRA